METVVAVEEVLHVKQLAKKRKSRFATGVGNDGHGTERTMRNTMSPTEFANRPAPDGKRGR